MLIRRTRPVDPTTVRISPHFVLSDFLGCHSVYAKGYANPFVFDAQSEGKLENLRALCEEALEPLMQQFGPLSIGYGYISPELSRRIVKYQDPDKPSHHRFDLGAAADVCVHDWVEGRHDTLLDLYLPASAVGSPIALAHGIDYIDIPYSRVITYSESPYVCVAVSAREVIRQAPRKAFYENRYTGQPKAKPDYRSYSNPAARARAFEALQEEGLPRGWLGDGYPTYHSGGFRQYHHMRVSKYTMVSDWLFDLKSISSGAKNAPSLNLDSVQDAFASAGVAYDWIIDAWGVKRASIVKGYVSHTNPHFNPDNDWRDGTIMFKLIKPDAILPDIEPPDGLGFVETDDALSVHLDVETVLRW